MIDEIRQELSRLEIENEIKILYAVESGSRAWGFASTDSDWDVRYIYIHKPDWYLQIDDKKDNHEKILPNDIDLAGWEMKKALRLFRKSNPPLLEWLRSPIIYSENFLQRIIENIDNSFINIIEFRNLSWWNQHVYNTLAQHNISFCSINIKDLPAEIIVNTANIYYRFHGIKKLYFSEYSKQTMRNFADELNRQSNINSAYIYFNNTATTAAINNAKQLKRLLEK